MPQTVTITKTLFTFDELDDSAKERARCWFRESTDENDYDCVIEDFQRIAEIIGITFDRHEVKLMGGTSRTEPDIWWSGFCSQGDGACFEGSYSYDATAVQKIRDYCTDEELIRIVDEFTRIQTARILLKRPLYTATMKKTSSSYSHEHTVDTTVDTEDDDDSYDASTADTIAELMRDLMRWLYKQLRAQDDYLNSDEYVDEMMGANEYTFDEKGNRDD